MLRRGPLESELGVGERHRAADAGHALRRYLHTPGDDLGVGEHLGEIVDRPGRHAVVLARRQ